MSVVEYRDRFLTLSRYALDETDTNEKRKERFLNGLHDEMQTVLVNIPFADLEALVDSAIQMEGKLHQANENRKRRMMPRNGPNNAQKYRGNSSGGFAPRYNKPPSQTYRPSNNNRNNNNNTNSNNNNGNRTNNNNHPNGNNNSPNTAPMTGSNTVPINPKDKSTITCYECGIVGHYSNECPKRLAKIAANTAAPAQNQRRFAARRNQNNNNGRLYNMTATEAPEAPQAMPSQALTLTHPSHDHGTLLHQAHAKETPGEASHGVDMTMPATSPLDTPPPFSLHHLHDHHVQRVAHDLLRSSVHAVDREDADHRRKSRAQISQDADDVAPVHAADVTGHALLAVLRHPDRLRSPGYPPRHAEPAGQAGVTSPRPPSPERTRPPAAAASPLHRSNCKLAAAASTRSTPEKETTSGDATASRRLLIDDTVPAHISDDRRSSDELADPLPPSPVSPPLAVDDDAPRPSIFFLITRPASPVPIR
ncbi:hypothetical protein QYE76_046491 [Lolium multiflorum]|uniref:CCHC-type domain-containing protein n=1 Tax=Lolium multiflorum TaxID=4521 RepID=A0AAD8TQ33_LOLMU|nr:hypothetical protein QYE76_046491 [Lolium multiflorum]